MSDRNTPAGGHMESEIHSQPGMWSLAAERAAATDALPADGERVAVVGCGTSWFIAQSYAVLRESRGAGWTDAFAASEAPLASRGYDRVIALSRSGTTSEVLEVLRALRGTTPTVGIVGDVDSPMPELVDAVVALPEADERSVVQTRFATTALALLRAGLGDELAGPIADAERALAEPIPPVLVDAEQLTFLGRGWSVGLAHEAALKMREASQSWTESYPAMEYRHGPMSIAAPGRAVWALGEMPEGLADEVASTGAHWEAGGLDPLAELVRVQRVALARARARGLDADAPRNLSRSVILEA